MKQLAYSVERIAYRKRVAHRSFLFAIFFLSAIRYPLSASYAVEVQPARLELTIPAHEESRGELTITNHASRAVDVRIAAGPYRFVQPGVRMPSAQEWLSFEPAEFTLAAGASSKVAYLIRPPQNILQDTAAEYLAAVLVDELPVTSNQKPATAAQAKITIVPRFALPVYLIVKGRELIQVELSDVTFKKADTALLVEVALRNKGTVHVRPAGTLAVLDYTEKLISSVPLGKGIPILPSGTLTIPTFLPTLPEGRYRAIVTVEPQPGEIIQKEIPFEVTEAGDIS